MGLFHIENLSSAKSNSQCKSQTMFILEIKMKIGLFR